MTSTDFFDPPINVLAASPRLEMILARLRDAGMRPRLGSLDDAGDEPLLVDTRSVSPRTLRELRRSDAIGCERTIVVLGDPAGAPSDIELKDDVDLASLPARLAAHQRVLLRADEARLRDQTREAFGVDASTTTDNEASVLVIGSGSALALALQNALTTEGVSVVGAFSARTAASYLSGQRFGAIAIDAGDRDAVAAVETLAASGAMCGTPVMALVPRGGTVPDTAHEILRSDAPIEDLAARIATSLWKTAASNTPPKDDRIVDPETGLYNLTFFERHLGLQMKTARQRGEAITLMSLRVRLRGDDRAEGRRATEDLARHVRQALRETDLAARIDWTTICVCLRDTSFRGATQLQKRLLSAFGQEDRISARILERRAYHDDPAEFIKSAVGGQVLERRRYA